MGSQSEIGFGSDGCGGPGLGACAFVDFDAHELPDGNDALGDFADGVGLEEAEDLVDEGFC